jgi:flagellar hook-associated protein 1 FlgK
MSLFSALSATANSLTAFESALTVTQNNINNSSTPGYAAEQPTFESLAFVPGTGQTGGVQAGTPTSTRDLYAEQNVQSNSSQLGQSQQQVESLTSLQNLFDITGQTGIPNALSKIYTAFSNWASSPNSTSNQQAVLSGANTVASAFQQTAAQVSQVASATDSSLSAELSQANALAARLSSYNAQIEAGDGNDPALQAKIYDTLQQLSQLANISTVGADNGTITVLLGSGQTPLVSGASANVLNLSLFVPQPPPPVNPNGPPTAHVIDSNGTDVTSELTGGKLGGLLNVRNSVLPSLQGDGNTTGSLNQLAKAFADRVNGLLTSGIVSAGPPVVNGSALFTYNANTATSTAASLQVNPAITTAQLAANDGTTSNGVALSLAGLSNSSAPADQIHGQNFSAYFGTIAAGIGAQLSNAMDAQSQAQDNLTQAESVRQQISGVDLNQQATQILQFQQAYEAASKVISVIDDMTQAAINMVGTSQIV